MNKVIIIGCGNVGMSYAYALINQRTKVDELVLIDNNEEKAIGEAMDLNHALPFSPSHLKVKVGSYLDCKDAKLIVICAGKNQLPGETRLDLITKNYEVFKFIISNIKQEPFNGHILIATNPVDIMTYITFKLTNYPCEKVIGSGTTLDTARLRYIVSNKLKLNPSNVHGYVIGEHGDSEFVAYGSMYIGMNNINMYLKQKDKKEIEEEVKNSAYEIIKRKGNTSYGIGMCLVKITNALLNSSNTILTVSSYDKENDVYYGKPTELNHKGATSKNLLNLNNEEIQKLECSINALKSVLKTVKGI